MIKQAIKLLKELTEYASYAEIAGGISVNRPVIRQACDDAFEFLKKFAVWNNRVWDKDPPEIVCLCGSTRFFETFQEASLQETVAGRIVLSIGCNLREDRQIWADEKEREEIKKRLDELHFRKIELANDVLVLNVGGYVGESTTNEIKHAIALGRPIRFWEPDNIPIHIASIVI